MTPEEHDIAEEESKVYISGTLSFIKDDPGRQAIGSFHPITDNDWTEMAYVGNTARLCQAIIDDDLEHVEDWLTQDGADPNCRDYTGRTPLHLAVTSSSPEIVQTLINHGARLVARLADGRTALHLAAARGHVGIVKMILQKSEENEEEESKKEDVRKQARIAAREGMPEPMDFSKKHPGVDAEDSDIEMVEKDDSDEDMHSTVSPRCKCQSLIGTRNVCCPPNEIRLQNKRSTLLLFCLTVSPRRRYTLRVPLRRW